MRMSDKQIQEMHSRHEFIDECLALIRKYEGRLSSTTIERALIASILHIGFEKRDEDIKSFWKVVSQMLRVERDGGKVEVTLEG